MRSCWGMGWRCTALFLAMAAMHPPGLQAAESAEAVAPVLELEGTQKRPPSEAQLREEQLRIVTALAEAHPESDDARYLLGLVYRDQGDTLRAMQYWRESLALDATRDDAHYDLGSVLLVREDFDEALVHLSRAAEMVPGKGEYQERLAYGRILAGRYEEALQGLDRAGITTALAQRFRGQALQRLGRYGEARAAYESALRLRSDFAEAYYGLAAVCMRLGEKKAAADYRRKFEEINSVNQQKLQELRRGFDSQQEAARSTSRTHGYAAQVYGRLGQPDRVEELCVRAAELDPGNIEVRLNLTRLYYETGRIDEAIEMCREMIRAEPETGSHHLSLGNLLRQQRRLAEAEAAYRRVVALAPERPEGFYALAQVLLETGQGPAEAETLARRAVEIAHSPAAYYLLSLACAARGDYPSALSAGEEACRLAPSNRRFRELRDEMRRQVGAKTP